MTSIASRRGFTLFELSIVLVIIGLITGSLIVGRDLYEAARARGVVKEINQYQQAILAFSSKYDSLPGDMVNPSQFWPSVAWSGNGDGNNVILWSKEGPEAWFQMQMASLIPTGNLNHTCTTDCVANFLPTQPNINIPRSTAIPNGGWTIGVQDITGENVLLFGAGAIGSGNKPYSHIHRIGITPILTARELWNIDSKIDDGIPTTGSLQTRNIKGFNACISGNTYRLSTLVNTVSCSFDVTIGQ